MYSYHTNILPSLTQLISMINQNVNRTWSWLVTIHDWGGYPVSIADYHHQLAK